MTGDNVLIVIWLSSIALLSIEEADNFLARVKFCCA